MYLVDTNIFLEILLNDPNRQACENFLNDNVDDLSISDFSLHSIGVILFRRNKPNTFNRFIHDVMPSIILVTLPVTFYSHIFQGRSTYNFDFDDDYQYSTAKYHGLILKTQDHHFYNVTDIRVEFL
jgi:uncharacterized protein